MRRTILRLLTKALLLAGPAAAAPIDIQAHIVSRVLPTYAPRHADALALTVADGASDAERTLAAQLADELHREGYRLVEKSEDARWILEARALAVLTPTPDDLSADGSAPQADLRLYLYSVTEFINGNPVPVWTATAYDAVDAYDRDPQAVLRLMLLHFGGDFDGSPKTAASAESTAERAAPH